MKDVKVIRQQVIDTMEAAIQEALEFDGVGFVVAYESDMTPLRVSGDTIRLVGKEIYCAVNSAHAQYVADGTNRKLGARGIDKGVTVLGVRRWKAARIAKMQEMIEDLMLQDLG